MERIVYRKTLDVHKNGIQFTLQGFETADNMARTIELSLMASGDTIDFPLEQVTAMMYVTTPNAIEPSINKCTIKDNKVIYDVLPIVEEGVTEMQVKLVETRIDGAKGVLAMPKFAIEVSKSNVADEGATQTTTFTALEDAIAKANGVYEARLLRIELDSNCMFRAYYADGTIYETDVLKELFLKGEALLSQSYARGGTGVRAGEDTDNSMYYSNVSKSASQDAKNMRDDTEEVLKEVRKHGVYTAFSVDFETGRVEYVSPSYAFDIDEESGELKVIGETYTFEETIQKVVTDWLKENGTDISAMQQSIVENGSAITDLQTLTNNHTQLIDLNAQNLQNLNSAVEGLIQKEPIEKFQIYLCETGATGPRCLGTLWCVKLGNVCWLYGTVEGIMPKILVDIETREFWISEDGMSYSNLIKNISPFKRLILATKYTSSDTNGFTDGVVVSVENGILKMDLPAKNVTSHDLHFDMMFIDSDEEIDGDEGDDPLA